MTDRPDDDLPGQVAGDEAEISERTHPELLEIINGELRKLWLAAQKSGADPEELRRLLEARRKTLEDRSDDPDD